MLKKFATWFIIFGLSFLVSKVFGWTEQGKAFLYIHLGIEVVIIIGLIILVIVAGHQTGESAVTNIVSVYMILVTAGLLAIILFATWGATKLFDVDFFVAYQIMTFGQCLCTENKKKDD